MIRRWFQKLLLRVWFRGQLPAEVLIAEDLRKDWKRFPIRDGDYISEW